MRDNAFFEARYGVNPLVHARDRHHYPLFEAAKINDAVTLPGSPVRPISSPLLTPMRRPLGRPMVRKMGTSAVDENRYSPHLWDGTPFQSTIPKTVGDLDITEYFREWDSVGWNWDRRANTLCVKMTTKGETYYVKIPGSVLQKIANKCLRCQGEKADAKPSLNGIFRRANRTRNKVPFLKRLGRGIKKVVKGIGKVALKIASSKVFAGLMTAIAVVPPLTAVGGAGLAAYAAANAVKPAIKAAETAVNLAKKAKGNEIVDSVKSGINSMPPVAKTLMVAALKTTPAPKSGDKAVVLKFQNGILSRV